MAGYYTQTNDALALQMSGRRQPRQQAAVVHQGWVGGGMGLDGVSLGLMVVDIYRWFLFLFGRVEG